MQKDYVFEIVDWALYPPINSTVEEFMRAYAIDDEIVMEALEKAYRRKLIIGKSIDGSGLAWQENDRGELMLELLATFKGMWFHHVMVRSDQ